MYQPIRHWQIAVCVAIVLASAAYGQEPPGRTTTCNFDPDKQLVVRYQPMKLPPKVHVLGQKIPYGQIWAPGGKPLTLFSNVPIVIGGKQLAIGAYTMFVIPSDKHWTLVISKSTDTSGKYDESDDLARIPMQYGELSSRENDFTVYFAHVAPDQCSMRLDLEKSRAWVILQER